MVTNRSRCCCNYPIPHGCSLELITRGFYTGKCGFYCEEKQNSNFSADEYTLQCCDMFDLWKGWYAGYSQVEGSTLHTSRVSGQDAITQRINQVGFPSQPPYPPNSYPWVYYELSANNNRYRFWCQADQVFQGISYSYFDYERVSSDVILTARFHAAFTKNYATPTNVIDDIVYGSHQRQPTYQCCWNPALPWVDIDVTTHYKDKYRDLLQVGEMSPISDYMLFYNSTEPTWEARKLACLNDFRTVANVATVKLYLPSCSFTTQDLWNMSGSDLLYYITTINRNCHLTVDLAVPTITNLGSYPKAGYGRIVGKTRSYTSPNIPGQYIYWNGDTFEEIEQLIGYQHSNVNCFNYLPDTSPGGYTWSNGYQDPSPCLGVYLVSTNGHVEEL
jgi:hypothetical protein